VFHAKTGPDALYDLVGDLPVYFMDDSSRHLLLNGRVVTVEALLGATGLVLEVVRCRPRTADDPPAQGAPRWPHRDDWSVL
jgi:hypothetical protein